MDILRNLMDNKKVIAEDSPVRHDLDTIAMKTEGYLPRDMNLLLDRAIHANVAHNRCNGNTEGKDSVKSYYTMNM